LFYERVAGGELVPANKHAQLGVLSPARGAQKPFDIPAVAMTGSFRMGDGSPTPPDSSDDAVITLRDPLTGDAVVLGNTHDLVYDRLVIPGVYDVHYSQESSGAVLPTNTNARLSTVEVPLVPNGFQHEIEIDAVQVSGTITLNGVAPPDSEYEDGRIYLRDGASGDSVLLGSTRDGQFSGIVVPGLYEVVYVAETAGEEVPVNSEAVIGQVEILAAKDLAIDVPAAALSGAILVNGEPPPGAPNDHGGVILVDALTADVVYLGDTQAGVFSRALAAGTYVVHFRGEAWQGGVPANTNAPIGCIVLSN
jgi:hypothetical protein